jgi:DNA-binding NarL/FixJ family response regulator
MKILIAEDHQLVIEAVKAKLATIGDDVTFVLAKNCGELLTQADDSLNLAIVDLSMPGTQGHSHVDELRSRLPALPVIVLSGNSDVALMRSLLEQSGVQGFIPKAYSSEVMLSAVRLVLAGGVYVPPMMLPALTLRDAPASEPAAAQGASDLTMENLRQMLTKRQLEVLELLAQGRPNKLIGAALDISEGTVKIHLAAVFRALGARNRTEAVIAAQALTKATARS